MTEKDYEVLPYENGSLQSETGLLMTNTVAKLSKNRRMPLLLINTTNKTLSIKQGTPVARVRPPGVSEFFAATEADKDSQISSKNIHEFDKVDVPPEHKWGIIRLLC